MIGRSASPTLIRLRLILSTVLNVTERSLLHVTVPMQVSTLGLALLAGGALVAMLMVLLTLAYALRRPVRDALAYE